jgi:ribosomal protein S15
MVCSPWSKVLTAFLPVCLRPAQQSSTTPSFLPLMQTANISMREKKRKQKQDPYKWAQAQQRKNANLGRRAELEKTRQEEWGDAVMGKTTPFLETLDSFGRKTSAPATDGTIKQNQIPTAGMRNYFLTDAELEAAASEAYTLTKPMVGLVESQMDSNAQQEREQQHEQRHERAVEALRRITSMENSSARDRFHANVRRIVGEFGRHNTDAHLRQRPESVLHPKDAEVPGRAGPDTGSSEVQIAILTTKIRGLARALQVNRGYKDKHNQRNLRLLMHRRQKLLKYMERKERGSERWTNMLEKLGLTPAMWKQQI